MSSLALAWLVRRRVYVYAGAVAASVPAIAYSMLEHGYLETGGLLHAVCAGVYALPFHYVFQRYRLKVE